nr:ribosomal protein L20 [Roya anglica]AHZ11095.1 ribosomal protein L20 [Roya anglica]
MTRVKRGYVARRRRNRILAITAGFKRAHSRLFRPANQQAMKALVSSSRDRVRRKRDFRQLWITRMNAAVRQKGISYSKFIHQLYKNKIGLNRKMISQIAVLDNDAFVQIFNKINEKDA